MRYVCRHVLPLRAGAGLAALRMSCPEEGDLGGCLRAPGHGAQGPVGLVASIPGTGLARVRGAWGEHPWDGLSVGQASLGWAQRGASIPGMGSAPVRGAWGKHAWDGLSVG